MEQAAFSDEDLAKLAELTIQPLCSEFASYCKQVKYFNHRFYTVTFLPTIEEGVEVDQTTSPEST